MRALLLTLALAYVMPAFSIMKRIANQRDELTLTALKLDGFGTAGPAVSRELSTALGTQWSAGDLSLSATWSLKFPGRCRLDLQSNESTKSLSVVSSNGKRRAEGPAFAAAQVAVDEVCGLLVLRSGTEGETRAALEKHLASLKVDTKQVALGRFAGNLAFVIGDKRAGSSQFWVYKERYLPARVKFTDEQNTQWDVRFIDYTSQATSDWLPRVVEVYRGEDLQLRVATLQADTRPSFETNRF